MNTYDQFDPINLDPVERIEAVVAFAFGGLHNAPKLYHDNNGPRKPWAYLHVGCEMSTYDGSVLTQLVISAHVYGVRVSVEPRMSYVRVTLYPRYSRYSEGAKLWQRHPDHEGLIYLLRRHHLEARERARMHFHKNGGNNEQR